MAGSHTWWKRNSLIQQMLLDQSWFFLARVIKIVNRKDITCAWGSQVSSSELITQMDYIEEDRKWPFCSGISEAVILALGRLRQQDCVSLKSIWATLPWQHNGRLERYISGVRSLYWSCIGSWCNPSCHVFNLQCSVTLVLRASDASGLLE